MVRLYYSKLLLTLWSCLLWALPTPGIQLPKPQVVRLLKSSQPQCYLQPSDLQGETECNRDQVYT